MAVHVVLTSWPQLKLVFSWYRNCSTFAAHKLTELCRYLSDWNWNSGICSLQQLELTFWWSNCSCSTCDLCKIHMYSCKNAVYLSCAFISWSHTVVSCAESFAVSVLSAVCQQLYSYSRMNKWSCIQLAGKLADLIGPGFTKVHCTK